MTHASLPIRVLLADDHTLVREGIRERLSRAEDIEVVGEAADGHAALSMTLRLQPDVLLLDMEMPGLTGVEVAQHVAQKELSVRVLALSAYDEEAYIAELLESGAAGYLTKEEPLRTIEEAIRGVAAGQDGWLSRSVAAKVMRLRQRHARPARGVQHPLSGREKEVLVEVAKGLTNQQVAQTLFVSENTVRNHLANIYGKLAVRNRAEAVAWALQEGVFSTR